MFNIADIDNTIANLRTQAKTLNTAADALEATVAPWRALQEQTAQMQSLMETWVKMFTPKT